MPGFWQPDGTYVDGYFALSGSNVANLTNKTVTANTNILTTNYTPQNTSKSTLMVMADTSGTLSLIVDGVSGVLNSGNALAAGKWYAFDLNFLSGSTYNLQLSIGATMQIKWAGGGA